MMMLLVKYVFFSSLHEIVHSLSEYRTAIYEAEICISSVQFNSSELQDHPQLLAYKCRLSHHNRPPILSHL